MSALFTIGPSRLRRAVTVSLIAVAGGSLSATPLTAQSSRPMGIDEVTRALVQGTGSGVLSLARERCIDFPVDAYTERLRLAGATSTTLGALSLVCRSNVAEVTELPAMRPLTELEQIALSRYPKPTMPKEPVQPVRPSVAIPVLTALAAGGGGFLGSAVLCTTTQTAPAPYGGFVGGRYLAPGESFQSKSSGCSAGIGAGAAAVLGLASFAVQRSQYGRSARAYELAAARYPAEKVNAERALRSWEAQVATTTTAMAREDTARRVAVEQRIALQARRLDSAITLLQREELLTRNALLAAQTAPSAPAASPAPAERARPTFPNDLAPPATRFRNPNAVAVVIGNRGYTRSEIPAVEYADRDAALMKRYLVESFGFREENIIFETDAGLSTFQRIFGSRESYRGQLFNFLAPDRSSDVFVFYSGHGAPDPATAGTFLVPTDADPQTLSLTGYPVRTLYENLAQLPARSLTVVLDACFSGLSDRGTLLRGISPLTLRVENPVLAAPNAVVLSASGGTEVSGWYDQKGHGLFTYVFLEQLTQSLNASEGRDLPTARALRERLTPEVVRLSRRLRQRDQTPQVFGQAADQPLGFLRR
jgi:hypothetical protein